jgi:hypothetical protein
VKSGRRVNVHALHSQKASRCAANPDSSDDDDKNILSDEEDDFTLDLLVDKCVKRLPQFDSPANHLGCLVVSFKKPSLH